MPKDLIDDRYSKKYTISNENLLKLHKTLFDNAYDIILYLSEHGNILTANKMAIKKYGYTYDELISKNIQDLRHFTMDLNYIAQMALSEYEGLVFEGVHVRKDGTTFPVEVSSKTIEFNNDKFRIHIIRDTTDRKKLENRTLYLANYDTLTNIANRANIISQLDQAIEKYKFDDEDLAFMIFDIDKFKIINDTFGHPIGDKVLQYVASSVKGLLRIDDSIARFGGDEFVIILRNVKNNYDILPVINRIFGVFQKPAIIENNSIKINISIGICLLSEAKNRDELIYQADNAMYEAKKKQGCSFEFFSNIKNPTH